LYIYDLQKYDFKMSIKTIKIDSIVDELQRVKGKRLSLLINKDAKVVIKAPHYAQISEINRFVESKRDWIIKSKLKVISAKLPERTYTEGEKFLYLGIQRELKIVNDSPHAVQYENGTFYLTETCRNDAANYISALYKNLAWNHLAHRIFELAKKHDFKIRNVKISPAKGRWGSCSSSGTINLAWRLVMAPPEVIDYVIIHELAHTVEHNHSDKFWAIVEKIVPDYKKNINWLAENGRYCDV